LSEDEKQVPDPWSNPPQGKFELDGGQYELLHGTFAAMVSEWDAELGEWFDLFRELGLEESAIWAVTSGHGQALGEHDWLGPHAAGLFEEMVHVPLILRLPGSDEAGRRIQFLTESIDLLPTLFDAFGHPLGDSIHGASLLPLAGGSQTPLKETVFQGLRGLVRTDWALRTPEWAFLFSEHGDDPPLLFRKPEDRWEVNDVRQQHLEWAEHLEATLRQFILAVARESFAAPKLKEYDEVVNEIR
jgi:arylsulfatase A-like enzyme